MEEEPEPESARERDYLTIAIEVNENSGLCGSLSKQPSVLTVRVSSFGVRSIGGR